MSEHNAASGRADLSPHTSSVWLPAGTQRTVLIDGTAPPYFSTGSPTVVEVGFDPAGEVVARRAMVALAAGEGGTVADDVVLYKNNVDGKGASYGAHENYLVRRDVDFDGLTVSLAPHLHKLIPPHGLRALENAGFSLETLQLLIESNPPKGDLISAEDSAGNEVHISIN